MVAAECWAGTAGPPSGFFPMPGIPGVKEMLSGAFGVAPAFHTALTAMPHLAGRCEMGCSAKRGARRGAGCGTRLRGTGLGPTGRLQGLSAGRANMRPERKHRGSKEEGERLKGKQKLRDRGCWY